MYTYVPRLIAMDKVDSHVVVDQSELEFEHIYKTHYKDMLNFTYSYVMDRGVAEDIVHDVFVKLWKKRDSLSDIDHIRRFVFTFLKNASLNHLRHLGIKDKHQEKLVEALTFSDTCDYLDDKELSKKVIGILDQLPDKQREVLYLKYFEGMKYADIAEKLSISQETVRTHVKRGMNTLKKSIPFIYFLICMS